MAAAFTERPARLAGEPVNSERSMVNRPLQALPAFILNVSVCCVLALNGCGNNKAAPSFQEEKKRYNEANVQLQNEAGIFTHNRQPFTGTVYSLLPNQRDTMAVGSFIDGKEDGEWRRYFAAGQLMEKRFYSAGKKAGVYEAWWPDGRQRLLYHFSDGEYEGACEDWAENGVLISEMNYHRGHEDGPQKQWYDNGKIKANYVIKDGRRYGLLGTKNCVNVSDSVFNAKGF